MIPEKSYLLTIKNPICDFCGEKIVKGTAGYVCKASKKLMCSKECCLEIIKNPCCESVALRNHLEHEHIFVDWK